jgi:hypothetical protein
MWNHEEIMRRGYVWVGISAQSEGVDGPAYEAVDPKAPTVFKNLKDWDPARYGSLHIGDEDLSYAIFTQIAARIGQRDADKNSPLHGWDVRRRIAMGNTYAAFRLVTYYNAVQPREKVFDAFLIGSRSRSDSAPLAKGVRMPEVVRLRTDIATPVIVYNTDAEVLKHYPARQPPGRYYRLWEIAGAAHTNAYWIDLMYRHMQRDFGLPIPVCSVEPGDLPQQYVSNAALWHLNRWADAGIPAPEFAPVAVNDATLALDKDAHGNTAGGVRLPALTVPVARYEAGSNPPCPGSPGHKSAFTAGYLKWLYPERQDYVARFSRAAEEAVAAGFLLKEDAAAMLKPE